MNCVCRRIGYLKSGFFNQFYASIEFTELMVASTGVSEYFHAIEPHQDVRTKDMSNMYCFESKRNYLAGVNNSSQSSTPMQVSTVLTTASPNGTLIYKNKVRLFYFDSESMGANLFGHSLDDSRKIVILPLAVFLPRGEET